ncbi:MAG: FAD-binding oxidoreductase [Candidatus Taylorbacteria bacterium]|nr:FAD-binding oxidoreductase [Candidatus Taylorbacteria bacterium]
MSSTWEEGMTADRYPALKGDFTADAVVVGGGITGVSAAYFLSGSGKRVILIDKENLKETVSAYTTAFLTYVTDTSLTELVDLYDRESARMVWQSGVDAIDMIETSIIENKIDCEFMRCDQFIFAGEPKEWRGIASDVRLARGMGFDVKKYDDALPFKNYGAAVVRSQAKFHPVKYLKQLKKIAQDKGALVFDDSEAVSVEGYAPIIVKTEYAGIEAPYVFIATHEPFNSPLKLFARKAEYTSYVIELGIKAGLLKEAMYLDQHNPYHYFRLDRGVNGLDRLVLGGEDHRHELPIDEEKVYTALEEYLKSLMPGITYEIKKKWSGPIIEPIDALPYIGSYMEDYPNYYVGTGFSGNGMTYGTLAGRMFANLVLGVGSPYTEIYTPLRKAKVRRVLRKGKDFAQEFVGGYLRDVVKRPKKRDGTE